MCVCVCVCVCVCLALHTSALNIWPGMGLLRIGLPGGCLPLCWASAVLPMTNLNGWTVLSAIVRFAGDVTKQGTSVSQSEVSLSGISVVLCSVVHAGGGFTLVVAWLLFLCTCVCVCVRVCVCA